MPTTAKKPTKKPAAKNAAWSGRVAPLMTAEQRSVDIKRFGKEIRKSKASAIAFLKRAGILDETGELATPYRP